MTKSIKEKERLELVRKIRESNFEFFDPEAIKIKIKYSNNKEVKAYYQYLNKNQFKTMLKNLLKDIAKKLNRFEFVIYLSTSQLFSQNLYICGLFFEREEYIGLLTIEKSQKNKDQTDFNILNFNQQIKHYNNLEVSLSINIFNRLSVINNKNGRKKIFNILEKCNLLEHFSMIENFINKLKYEYNFDICSHYTGIRSIGWGYNISNNTYYCFHFSYQNSLTKRQIESSSIRKLNYPIVNDESQLLKYFIEHKLFPEELDDIYKELSIKEIIEHTKMALY